MDRKKAVLNYLFSERAKTDLITVSKMLALLSDYKGAERSGAKKFIVIFLGSVQSDLSQGFEKTGSVEFSRASEMLEKAKNYLELDDLEQASLEIGRAVSECTTPAQNSWQVLAENELV